MSDVREQKKPLRAVKLELEILTEASQPMADIVEGIKEAMEVYCEFEASHVKIVEDHKVILACEGELAEA